MHIYTFSMSQFSAWSFTVVNSTGTMSLCFKVRAYTRLSGSSYFTKILLFVDIWCVTQLQLKTNILVLLLGNIYVYIRGFIQLPMQRSDCVMLFRVFQLLLQVTKLFYNFCVMSSCSWYPLWLPQDMSNGTRNLEQPNSVLHLH